MTPLEHSTNIAARMGRWSAHHKKTAIAAWLSFVVAAVVVGGVLGTKKLDPAQTGVGEAGRAQKLIASAALGHEASESVLVSSPSQRAGDPAFRQTLAEVVRAVSHERGVSHVSSPAGSGGGRLVSKDGHSALVRFDIADGTPKAATLVAPVLDAVAAVQARHPGFRVEELGDASAQRALDKSVGKDFSKAEYTAIPITLGVLLVVFGALVAAGIPLLVGLTAVLAALGLLALPSRAVPMGDGSSFIVLLVGLAVGVDYSLFYLKREREERAAGKGPEAALAAAAATSGRAILVSGLTVLAALSGMLLGGDSGWISIGVGTMLVVAIAVVGSLTVLPATLGWLGDRVDRGRIPYLARRRRHAGEARLWGFVLDRVLRRPALSAGLAAGFLLLLAAPALALKTADPGINAIPHDLPIMQTYDRIQTAFPGGPLPAVVAIQAPDVNAAPVRTAIARLRRQALATGLMSDPITVQESRDARLALVSVPLAGNGTDDASLRALARLRGDVIPHTVGALPGVEVAVAGTTAVSKDFSDLMAVRQPLAMGFVLILAFLLLLVAFRSLVIATKAVLLNLLSVAAAYGLLVAVFQWGWGARLLGFEPPGALVSGLPLFLFVILFGLSMDYHVFILSRIREAYDRGLSTTDAVSHGIKTTVGVVSAAAFVMVAVFGIFLSLSPVLFKEFGLGLGAAILIDATIVRAVLLPATMELLGRWNWYLPRWLEWLPRLEREAPAPAALTAEPVRSAA